MFTLSTLTPRSITTIGPHAHRIEIQVPRSFDHYDDMVEALGIPKGRIPSATRNGWTPDPFGRRKLFLDDLRLRPYEIGPKTRLSPTKAVRVLDAEDRRPLNGLGLLGLADALNKGEIKMSASCKGIHVLGAGVGKRVLVLRWNHGELELVMIPSNRTIDHCFASCKVV